MFPRLTSQREPYKACKCWRAWARARAPGVGPVAAWHCAPGAALRAGARRGSNTWPSAQWGKRAHLGCPPLPEKLVLSRGTGSHGAFQPRHPSPLRHQTHVPLMPKIETEEEKMAKESNKKHGESRVPEVATRVTSYSQRCLYLLGRCSSHGLWPKAKATQSKASPPRAALPSAWRPECQRPAPGCRCEPARGARRSGCSAQSQEAAGAERIAVPNLRTATRRILTIKESETPIPALTDLSLGTYKAVSLRQEVRRMEKTWISSALPAPHSLHLLQPLLMLVPAWPRVQAREQALWWLR